MKLCRQCRYIYQYLHYLHTIYDPARARTYIAYTTDNTDMTSPTFRLFRLTKPMDNGCTHAGEVWIKGNMWTITAKVVETDQGRQFHGHAEPPGDSIRKRVDAKPPKDDLVTQAEGTPFDDPLPGPPF